EQLRHASPGLDVILMTGSLTDQDTHLVRALRERAFYFILKPFEREVLLALVDRCLETRRLRNAEQQNLRRIERELATARAFQHAMLPAEHACVASMQIDARCQSCSELGGDLFDFVEDRDGRLAFIIADVTGHGVPAALLTGAVKSAFRAGIARGERPAGIAASLVRSLESFSTDRFVTAFCGSLCPRTNELRYVNAGHPAGLLLTGAAETDELPSNGPLLSSMFPLDSWSDCTMTLPAPVRLFLHTDGVNETRGNEGCYSIERALERLRAERSNAAALDGILEDLRRFRGERPAHDDITMMVVEKKS
ncbi:MAG: PP2C family protein-serine/threonine phosphatase, partial [Planctomycetota bacterium]